MNQFTKPVAWNGLKSILIVVFLPKNQNANHLLGREGVVIAEI